MSVCCFFYVTRCLHTVSVQATAVHEGVRQIPTSNELVKKSLNIWIAN